MIELLAMEKMALSAVALPILMSEIRIVTARETRSALMGISNVRFDYKY
jgi:hypothetical protein